MVRVAFFAEILIPDFDGAARTMFQLIDRIDRTKHDFLFVYGNGPDRLGDFESFRTPTLRLPVNDDYSLSLPVLTKQKLEKTLDRFDPQVVHIATPSPLGFFALKYAQQRDIPVMSIYHTHFISYIPYYFKNFPFLIKPVEKWMLRSMRKFYNGCSRVYAPTPAMVDYLCQQGVDPSKTELWQRGIDLRLFNPEKRNPGCIQKITGNNRPTILFASRLVWEKNIETLIQIYKKVQERGLPYNLVIAGDGNAFKEAKALMPGAVFLGKLAHDELSVLYASADVFLFTSVSETYGNVVIEAMASGLPCVIADGGGSADLIVHNQTGFKARPYDAEDYLEYLEVLLEQPILRQVIRENALEVVQRLDWEVLVGRYFDDLEELANNTAVALGWTGS